jgi:hypothetical protein
MGETNDTQTRLMVTQCQQDDCEIKLTLLVKVRLSKPSLANFHLLPTNTSIEFFSSFRYSYNFRLIFV